MFSIFKPTLLKKKDKLLCAQILFFGPLYSLTRTSRYKLHLRLHFSGEVIINIPKGLILHTFKKRLIIFGKKLFLANFLNNFINLRESNVYTGTGLRIRPSRYYTKAGKIRRR